MPSATITAPFLTAISNVKFANAAEINAWFKTKTGSDFVTWFNANMALRDNWKDIKMATDTDMANRFNSLWDLIPVIFGTPAINLLQFISLMSIVNNETGGRIKPVTELIGNPANPGLSYAFNKIPGTKKSYNTLTSNLTAFDLFNNADYIAAHGTLPLGNVLKKTTDIQWKGEVYPAGIETSTDPLKSGFVGQADFFKFRGRGFIQTTTRGNYKQLVDFVQKYTGANAVIKQYQTSWKGKTTDTVATISTNKDWDALFQASSLVVPAAAISIHNKSAANYLGKITLVAGVDANIKLMGKAISGSNSYADLFLKRVIQIANGLGN
jgi:hypothetical protein